ncbi:MAG: CoA ester lyase [Pseudomonadota bacterium]
MTAFPRSWLFIPGDSEKKLGKIADCGADAVIIDLEDSVAASQKDAARQLTASYLADHVGHVPQQLWVRINPLDSPWCAKDVAEITAHAPMGLVLPKAEGPSDVERLSAIIDAADEGARSIRIHAIATETPRAVLKLPEFADCPAGRLSALSWGAEDLATAIGASANRDENGRFLDVFQNVRIQALLAAHAAGVQAIETLHADYRDDMGLRQSSEAARIVGFTGRLAIHPAQVPIINAAFLPSEAEAEWAQRIVAAFADAGAVGTVGIDGKMIDRPHLLQSQTLLARWKEYRQ